MCGAIEHIELERLLHPFFRVITGPRPSRLKGQPWSSQLPVWTKFARGAREFTSIQAGAWLLAILGDRQERHEHMNINGFTRLAGSVHNFLLNLETQGLLESDRNVFAAQRLVKRAPNANEKLERAIEIAVADGR